MFELFDGTDKKIRDSQKACLKFLEDSWNKSDVFVINAPTASGKSALSRAIQIETGADIITINNHLVRQFVNEYKATTAVIGRKHYLNPDKYNHSRGILFSKERNAIFNPVSFVLCDKMEVFERADVIILDEADQHIGLLLEVISTPISVTKSEYDKALPTSNSLKSILLKRIKKNVKLLGREDINKEAVTDEQAYFKQLVTLLEKDSSKLAVSKFIDERAKSSKTKYKIKITPIKLPTNFLKQLYDGRKVILMSGSIFKTDVPDILGYNRDFLYYEVDSPIPVEKRLIKYEPLEEELCYGFDYKKVAEELNKVLEKYPERPAAIHTTYKDSEVLRDYLRDCKFNTKEDKDKCIDALEGSNDVLLASGMYTGVDFKDDKCRLNIILKAQYPNLNDLWVKKKRVFSPNWYHLQTLRHLIQAAGRSTRTPDDFSTTVICDPRLMDLIADNWKVLPEYFKDALVLGKKSS